MKIPDVKEETAQMLQTNSEYGHDQGCKLA